MLKVGIIGAGSVARAHARGLATLKTAELAGVHDVKPDAARALTGEFGGIPVSEVGGLLEIADAVIVASPNFTHRDHALAVLRAGRSVLCEKPLALSPAEAEKMVESAHSAATPALVGFNYRHLPVVHQLNACLLRGDLGIPCSVELGFRKNSALRRKTSTWRDRGDSRGTSGALGDLGVHLIDLLTFLTGGRILVDECRARVTTHVTTKSDEAVEVDDHSEVYGRLSTGTFFSLVASKATPEPDCGFSLRVVGTEGAFNYHSAEARQARLESGSTTENIDLSSTLLSDPANEVNGWSDSFRSELRHWFDGLAGPSGSTDPVLATFEDGLAAQDVLGSLLEAATNGADGRLASAMVRS